MTHILSDTDLVILRQFPQTLTRFLSVCPRAPVFQAQVVTYSTDPTTNGVISITFAAPVLGRYQNVVPGLTVDVGSTQGGREYGSMRIRKAATSSVMYVAETSRGECLVAAGLWLTVRDERRLWSKLPLVTKSKSATTMNFDDTFAVTKDYDQAYTDENQYHRPLACITGKPAGWVDDGQTYRTVDLDSSGSAAVAKSATIASRSWNLIDGSFVSGYSSSDTTIQATFPPGFRYVELTVTDSNSKTSTRYFPVWAHDAAHPPITAFEVTGDETEAGREMTFILRGEHSEFDEAVIPEGALICYWEDEVYFGDDLAPAQYRDQYLGWATGDSTQIKLNEGQWELRTAGPAYWLDKIESLPAAFLRDATPATWNEMIDITDDRVAVHVLRYHSTALDVCNLYLSGVTDEWGQSSGSDYVAAQVTKASLWQQITGLAAEYCGFPGCDSLGGIWLRRHPPLMDAYSVTDRDDVETVIALTQGDTLHEPGIAVNNELALRAGEVEMDGFTFSGTVSTPLRARAPGRVPSQAVSREQAPAQVLSATLVTAYLQLKDRAGHWLAWVNNPNADQPVELIGNLDIIEPAWREWITITASEDNPRGISLSAARFIVKRVSVQHSNDPTAPAKKVVWTVDQETEGLPGDTIDIETCATLPDEPYDWDVYPKNDWGDPAPLQADAPDLVYTGDEAHIWRSENCTDSLNRSWSTIGTITTIAGAGYTQRAGHPSRFAPKTRLQIVVSDGTYVKIYETTDLDATVPSWSLKKTITSGCYRAMLYAPPSYAGAEDRWVLFLQPDSEHMSVYVTDDNWSTSIDNVNVSDNFPGAIGCAVSPVGETLSNTHIFVADYYASFNQRIKASLNGGSDGFSSAYGSFNSFYTLSQILFPWLNNPNQLIYYAWGDDSCKVWKTVSGGALFTDITPSYGGSDWGYWPVDQEWLKNMGMAWTPDPSKLTLVLCENAHGDNQRVFTSDDAGATLTPAVALNTFPSSAPYVYGLEGWPYDVNICFAFCSDRLLYTTDRFATAPERIEPSGYTHGTWFHAVELA